MGFLLVAALQLLFRTFLPDTVSYRRAIASSHSSAYSTMGFRSVTKYNTKRISPIDLMHSRYYRLLRYLCAYETHSCIYTSCHWLYSASHRMDSAYSYSSGLHTVPVSLVILPYTQYSKLTGRSSRYAGYVRFYGLFLPWNGCL